MDTMIITGGCGFIGSHFTRMALAETDALVVVVDKLTYAGHLDNLNIAAQHPRFVFCQGDISDRKFIEALLNQYNPTVLVNLAAETHVDRSIDNSDVFIQTNFMGVYVLLEAIREYLASKRESNLSHNFKFLHVSTDEVYGSLGNTGSFDEESPYLPNSPYSASKAAADHMIRAYHETYGLPVLITNASNNYGPFQFPEKLVPLMILNALERKPLPIYGDGKNIRDWLYVEDHCKGIFTVLKSGRLGEKYNIGGECELNNLQVVDLICEIIDEEYPHLIKQAGSSEKKIFSCKQLKTYVADRPGHDKRYALNTSKIRRELEWKPRQDFKRALRDTIKWYIENREWCTKVQSDFNRQRLGISINSKFI